MPKLTVNQTNFSGGEISPKMRGRTDVKPYLNGADTIENGRVDVHGGVVRRDGTRFVAIAKLAGTRKVRLVRYVFNEDQAYMIEFGHLYLRFFDPDGGVLLDATGTVPLELASPYTEDQLFDVTTKQGGDTMFLFHPDVAPQRLRRVSAGLFVLQAVPWTVKPFAELGHQPNAQLSLSATTVGSGRTFTTAPVTVPSAPTIGAVTPLNAAANIAFLPPHSTGGLPITSYTATATPGGATATATRSPIRIPGLVNGTTYTSANVTPSAALPDTAITITPSLTDYRRLVLNGTITGILGPSVIASGSIAPYHYAWTKRSGSAAIKLTSTKAAQLKLTSTGVNTTNYAIVRCTVTDNYGGSAFVDFNVAVTHQPKEHDSGSTR
jgi:hypothetical protein